MMVAGVNEGNTVCITPDGPTGPRHVMKIGALLTAGRTGVPLVIAGIAVKRKKVLGRSWDRFEIPMPFSEVCIWYDEPIVMHGFMRAADPDREAVREVLESIQTRLAAVHMKAHEKLGITPIE